MKLIICTSADLQAADQIAAALKNQAIPLQDAAVSIRQADGSNRMWTRRELVGDGHLGGMFWGVLFALIYWSRFWGLNIGSIVADYGIDDEFIKDVSLKMTRGHSTLALLAADEQLDAITGAMNAFDAQVFTYTLAQAAIAKLDAIFASGQQ
jgi:uncharacterized membrane protein